MSPQLKRLEEFGQRLEALEKIVSELIKSNNEAHTEIQLSLRKTIHEYREEVVRVEKDFRTEKENNKKKRLSAIKQILGK